MLAVGLMTGNIVGGARLKLGSAGLPVWPVGGASDSVTSFRNEFPDRGCAGPSEAGGFSLAGDRVVIVGDTPRDVECGRHHGTRTVGVATGELHRRGAGGGRGGLVLESFPGVLDRTLEAPSWEVDPGSRVAPPGPILPRSHRMVEWIVGFPGTWNWSRFVAQAQR